MKATNIDSVNEQMTPKDNKWSDYYHYSQFNSEFDEQTFELASLVSKEKIQYTTPGT